MTCESTLVVSMLLRTFHISWQCLRKYHAESYVQQYLHILVVTCLVLQLTNALICYTLLVHSICLYRIFCVVIFPEFILKISFLFHLTSSLPYKPFYDLSFTLYNAPHWHIFSSLVLKIMSRKHFQNVVFGLFIFWLQFKQGLGIKVFFHPHNGSYVLCKNLN